MSPEGSGLDADRLDGRFLAQGSSSWRPSCPWRAPRRAGAGDDLSGQQQWRAITL